MTPAEPAPVVTDAQLVRVMTPIALSFAAMLAAVALLGALVLVPHPAVGFRGLLVGAVLAVVAWFLPMATTRGMLASARRANVADAGVPAAARTAAFGGIAAAEVPALIAFVLVVFDGHDVGALVVAAPVAMVSLLVNAAGPAALRRHLARLRVQDQPVPPGLL